MCQLLGVWLGLSGQSEFFSDFDIFLIWQDPLVRIIIYVSVVISAFSLDATKLV